ncbi:MAG: Uncharacterised protein [Cryomorphaceae bacterium]|nr:MAG: Uncharacterised protein [Cryomorphaceae bacterium]
MAQSVNTTATQIDKERVASSADGNQAGSYMITQNHGAITQAHWPIH